MILQRRTVDSPSNPRSQSTSESLGSPHLRAPPGPLIPRAQKCRKLIQPEPVRERLASHEADAGRDLSCRDLRLEPVQGCEHAQAEARDGLRVVSVGAEDLANS